ncbi:polysaccharide biosynthesis protein [Georgenia sp. SUBG003]|uniref:polysaccharide biosynthesis protein n=1 Tax=Georgenia sp. SUBG003 TaxID=1497974 RepID=UPI003AB2D010
MTIPEASELVIQAAAIGRDAEVLVLDMGEPVKILDVAKRLITHSGKDIEIVFTGLRPNEKMHEELFSVDEEGARPLPPAHLARDCSARLSRVAQGPPRARARFRHGCAVVRHAGAGVSAMRKAKTQRN